VQLFLIRALLCLGDEAIANQHSQARSFVRKIKRFVKFLVLQFQMRGVAILRLPGTFRSVLKHEQVGMFCTRQVSRWDEMFVTDVQMSDVCRHYHFLN
jgi:hypothetical protein